MLPAIPLRSVFLAAAAIVVISRIVPVPANAASHFGDSAVEEFVDSYGVSSEGGSSSDARAHVQDATSDADAVAKWARSRLGELQQQQQQQQQQHNHAAPTLETPPPPHEDLDYSTSSSRLLELLNSDTESFSSPEDYRNLFYSDAARAEVSVGTAPHSCSVLL